MESVPRKRKLVDCGSNISVLKKHAFGDEGILHHEENELNICNQYQEFAGELGAIHLAKEGSVSPKSDKSCVFFCLDCKQREKPSKAEPKTENILLVLQGKPLKNLVKISEENDDKSRNIAGNGSERICSNDEEVNHEESAAGETCDKVERMWFSTDYIEDIISHEMRKEAAYQLSSNFCRKFEINPTGREILIDWLISVQVHLKAENGTLHLAVALLDLMLDSVPIPINELQAAAVAAFWVAYKYIHGSLSMKTLLNLCSGSVTKSMIEANEMLVLQTSCLLQAGGSLTVFFNYLLYKIFGFKFPPDIYYCGLYFIEIMLLQFVFKDCQSCEKAVTAVFTALNVFGYADRFADIDISNFITKRKLLHAYRLLMRSLRLMYKDRDALKNSNVYRKYKSSRYFKISIHQCLKCLASA